MIQQKLGTLLFNEGDVAGFLYLVEKGVVQEQKSLADGRRVITAFRYPGELVGLALEHLHGCAAEAATDVRLRCFSRQKLLERIEPPSELHQLFLSHLAQELWQAQNHLLTLARKTATERVASFLVELSDQAARRGNCATRLWIPMSRQAIADHLGLTLETVSRVFSQLRRKGTISAEQDKFLKILDLCTLQDLAGRSPNAMK